MRVSIHGTKVHSCSSLKHSLVTPKNLKSTLFHAAAVVGVLPRLVVVCARCEGSEIARPGTRPRFGSDSASVCPGRSSSLAETFSPPEFCPSQTFSSA